jgi:hypothetical protein
MSFTMLQERKVLSQSTNFRIRPWNSEQVFYNKGSLSLSPSLSLSLSRPPSLCSCNRLVLFQSDLYHKTDFTSGNKFKKGYKNRRINVTLLFGKRQQRTKTVIHKAEDSKEL